MSQAEEEEGVNRATQEFVSIQMSNFSADLLQKLVSRTHFSEKLKEEEEADEEEIELSLGLSLNGRFGVDPARAKNGDKFSLKRSSSIPDFATSQGESECHVTTAARCHVGLARTCSLPTETEEEWRKRKELQSLRRMEAKRKRSEKQRNSISKAIRTSGRADLESNNNGGDKDNGLPPQAASFQGSTGSHGSGSSGVSESDCRASQGQTPPKASISESEIPNDSGAGFKKHEQVIGCCVPIQDVPLPLATKIYYSQRNNRLRSALCHLYYEAEATTKEFRSDSAKMKLSNENMYPTQVSSQDMLPTQMNNAVNNERDSLSLPPVQNPDQILAQSSEVCLGTSGVCLPPSDFSKQFPVDNVQRPQVAPVGLARNTYLSKPFSFATNSGQPLGAAQQQNGSVSVL